MFSFSMKSKKSSPANRGRTSFLDSGLGHCDEKANHDGKQSDTFYEGCGQNHVRSDITGNFGLACDGFQSTLADSTDTDTSTNGCETGTDTGTHFTDGTISCCLQ